MECTGHSKHEENEIAGVLLPVIQAASSSRGTSYFYLKVPPTAKHENLAAMPQCTSSQPQDQQPQQALGSVERKDTAPLGPHRLQAAHRPQTLAPPLPLPSVAAEPPLVLTPTTQPAAG